jgi:mono/diheme cytochrome c family protein
MRSFDLPSLPLLLGLLATTTLTACGSPGPDFGGEGGTTGGFAGDPTTTVGEGPQGAFTGQGRELFLKTVAHTLETSCSDCHAHADRGAPVFMASTPESTYLTLSLYGGMIAPAANSRLLQHGTHAGADLPAEQRQLVVNWLDLEASERSFVAGGGLRTLEQVLSEVGGCMSQAEWTANGLDGLSDLKTQAGDACSSCHSSGDSGVFLNADPQKTFEGNRKVPVVNRWVRGNIDTENGLFLGLSEAGVLASYGKAPCDSTAFDGCHPAYELPSAIEQGIAAFSTVTIDRVAIGPCGIK